jgi:hypothetical protein
MPLQSNKDKHVSHTVGGIGLLDSAGLSGTAGTGGNSSNSDLASPINSDFLGASFPTFLKLEIISV